ncbi:MAG: hypothetical protein OXG79_12375 [Chloroflexi bacterium]|nr:hypothetical protein [Chloroflexota bacterium]
MARTIAAADSDIATGFAVADGIEAVRQRVLQRLRLFRGESFLDAEAGVPYLTDLLGERLPSALAGSIIADQIRDVPGVLAVDNVDAQLDPRTRRLSVTADVTADDGTASVSVTV